MGRDYSVELERRVSYIADLLKNSGAKGIVFGNSGGKDSALCGILCRRATEAVLGVCMPCQSTRNFGEDLEDGEALARQFDIRNITVDLSPAKQSLTEAVPPGIGITAAASSNIAPRLRMTTLYAIGQSLGYLVCGTGNASEYFMGYFTKWGDGAYDFNPIADLTVTEIYEFMAYLEVPASIQRKAPSAGLFEGQTDEQEMGVTYRQIDRYIAEGSSGDAAADRIIERYHSGSRHKRSPMERFGANPAQ